MGIIKFEVPNLKGSGVREISPKAVFDILDGATCDRGARSGRISGQTMGNFKKMIRAMFRPNRPNFTTQKNFQKKLFFGAKTALRFFAFFLFLPAYF